MLLQRFPHACEVVDLLPDSSPIAHPQQPPATLERVVNASSPLHSVPALLVKEPLQLRGLDELGVRVRAGGDEAEDGFSQSKGEELSERSARDGGEEKKASGLVGGG